VLEGSSVHRSDGMGWDGMGLLHTSIVALLRCAPGIHILRAG
jgi:hypothetical protein